MTLTFQGVVKHLHLLPHELEDYEEQVEKVMRRYVKRLQWLLSGSRRVFGTITEKHVSHLCNESDTNRQRTIIGAGGVGYRHAIVRSRMASPSFKPLTHICIHYLLI